MIHCSSSTTKLPFGLLLSVVEFFLKAETYSQLLTHWIHCNKEQHRVLWRVGGTSWLHVQLEKLHREEIASAWVQVNPVNRKPCCHSLVMSSNQKIDVPFHHLFLLKSSTSKKWEYPLFGYFRRKLLLCWNMLNIYFQSSYSCWVPSLTLGIPDFKYYTFFKCNFGLSLVQPGLPAGHHCNLEPMDGLKSNNASKLMNAWCQA